MKYHLIPCAFVVIASLSACHQTANPQPVTSDRDTCGADQYQNLVGVHLLQCRVWISRMTLDIMELKKEPPQTTLHV